MTYLENIKELIEQDIVLNKKHRIIENNCRLTTYFEIGRLIIEAQGGEDRAKYGNGLIKQWSKELTALYGRGYDISNLKRMRQFFLTFEKGATVWHQLSWSHLKYILSCQNQSERNYYINISIKQNLSVRQLKEKIKNNEYERLEYKEDIELINKEKEITIKDMIKTPVLINTSKEIDKLSEKALKGFILEKIEEFLLEFIVIELKIRTLKPSDIGK